MVTCIPLESGFREDASLCSHDAESVTTESNVAILAKHLNSRFWESLMRDALNFEMHGLVVIQLGRVREEACFEFIERPVFDIDVGDGYLNDVVCPESMNLYGVRFLPLDGWNLCTGTGADEFRQGVLGQFAGGSILFERAVDVFAVFVVDFEEL